MKNEQNYQNHVRYFPLFHYFLVPVLAFNLIWQVIRLFQEPTWDRAEWVLMAIAFIGMVLAARLQALTAQDRVIRLEEKMRYSEVLSEELLARAANLEKSQWIALRFAPDEELPMLVEKVLNGDLKDSKSIKTAIKNWKGDHLRV